MTDCLHLDDYLDGRLSEPDAERFESHTVSCPDCDAALDAQALPELARLRDAACPPQVLQAALVTARRAPDRGAVRQTPRFRTRWAVVALAAFGAVALALGLTRVTEPATVSSPVAEADVPVAAPDPIPPPLQNPPVPVAEAAPSAPAPRPVATPAPPDPAPIAAAPAPLPDAAVGDETPPSTDTPTPEEIEAAQRDLALAFHLVAEAQTRAGDALRTRSSPVTAAIGNALPF